MKVSKTFKSLQATCQILQLTSYTSAAIVLVALWIYNKEYNSPIYTTETDYTKWVTPLPAVTICTAVNRRHIAEQLKRLAKEAPVSPRNVTFFANLVRKGKKYCQECDSQSPVAAHLAANLSDTISLIAPPCESQLIECTWNDIKFSCCQFLQPLLTKIGYCYSLNSLQTRTDTRIPFNFVTSHLNPQAELKLNASTAISVHVHDRRAVSLPSPRPVFQPGEKGEILYKFQETIIGPTAKELSSRKRRCVFDDEVTTEGYTTYSYSACKLNCLAEKQMQVCGCKYHHLQGLGVNCGYEGLKCLDQHFNNKTERQKCNCKKNCTEQDIHFVFISAHRTSKREITSVTVKLTQPPKVRYVLNARTNFIETLVAVACFFRIVAGATFEDIVYAGWVLVSSYVSLAFIGLKWIFKKIY